MLGFESILFALAVLKVIKAAKEDEYTPRLLVILLRDSVAYFGSIFGIILANVLIQVFARVRLADFTH